MGNNLNTKNIMRQVIDEGWCVIPSVIPAGEVDYVRDSVLKTTLRTSSGYEDNDKAVKKGANSVSTFLPSDVSATKGLLAHDQSFAKYLPHPNILGTVDSILGPHVRISYTTSIINMPGNARGGWHSDWPFNQKTAGHIPSPYPDFIAHITTIWMLSPFSKENGGTLVVPRSHTFNDNPTGDNDLDPNLVHPDEINVTGNSGDVLMFDSRLWHATSANTTESPRVGLAVRYAPWWLNLDVLMPGSDERQRMVIEPQAQENEVAPISTEIFNRLPKNVKPLMRHWVRD